jgi:O-antigen/teichoic acid export membrane protein
MFSGTAVQAGFKMLVLAILARMLSPTDFGLVNAAAVVMALGDIFAQLGVAPALVQKDQIDDNDITTAWLASAILGIVCGVCCYFAAPAVAQAFRMPDLAPIIQWVAWIFPVRGASLVPEALLQRRMCFRQIAGSNLLGYLLGYAGVAVTLAVQGAGVWALVGGQIAQYLLTGVLLTSFNGRFVWARPGAASFLRLMQFGTGLTVARIGSYVSLNVDSFFAGRLLGPVMLGFYSRAFYFLQQPTAIFGSLADRVLFPAFSSIQHDSERVAKAFLGGTGLVFILTAPASGALAVIAPELVETLLGHQWQGAVRPFQCLIISLPFRVASKMQGTILRSLGRVYVQAAREWGCAVLICVGAWTGAMVDGVGGLSAGVLVALLINYVLGALSVRRVAALSLGAQARCMWKPVIWSVVVFGAIGTFRNFLVESEGIPTAASVSFVLVAIAFVLLIVLGPRLYGESGKLLIDLMKKRLAYLRRG